MPLLAVEDLAIAFGGLTALDGVSLEVATGEIVALIGPNGAGKSTVFNVLSGLYRADGGHVVFDGADIATLAPHERARLGIGRTFQNTEVFRALSVLNNILVDTHTRLRRGALAAAC